MTTFESQPASVHKNREEVYNLFSDLNNIEKIVDKLPADKVRDLEYTTDTCTFSISPLGKVGFRIKDRVPFEQINFVAENAPIDLSFRIDFQEQAENETIYRIVAEAELNPFIKAMVSKPIQDAVDKLAEGLTAALNQ
jgi:carbon monoxide dehydrogenase subunit G